MRPNRCYSLLLCIALALAGCVKFSKDAHRRVELPPGDSRTSLATAQQICRDLIEGGFALDIQSKFPALTEEQRKGVFLSWEMMKFSGPQGVSEGVFIKTGIRYQGDLPQAREIADYCESLVQTAVTRKFILPAKPAPK